MKKFTKALITIFTFTALIGAANAISSSDWSQVNVSGFGDIDNTAVYDFTTWSSYLIASSGNGASDGKVWRYDGGTTWTQINTDSFGDANNWKVVDVTVHGGDLYASTSKEFASGAAEVWKYSGSGTSWSQVNADGFGDASNISIEIMYPYGGYLYAATHNSLTGTEVWRCSTCDGSDWSQANADGFGFGPNITSNSMVEYNSMLYVGTYNDFGSATDIWRCSTCDGTDWALSDDDGWGDPSNSSVESMAVYNSKLYAATRNWGGLGGEVWACTVCDDSDWTQVNSNGFGSGDNATIFALATFGSNLYAGTYNWGGTGTEIWEYDGSSWTQANSDGFGVLSNQTTYALYDFDDYLYAGTSNGPTGAQIWAAQDALPADLSLTITVDDAAPQQTNTITYTTTVTNDGPGDATTILVSIPIETGLTYVSQSASSGSYDEGRLEAWLIDSLSSGSSATLDLTFTVGAAVGTTITTTGEIVSVTSGGDPDSTPGNSVASEDDQDSVDLTVAAPTRDLELTKTVDNASPQTGQTISYTIKVKNTGTEEATGIQVTDTLSSDVAFLSYSSSQGEYANSTGIWSVGSLTSGAEAVLTLNANVMTTIGGTVITNSAEVTACSELDTDSTPNNDDSSEDDQDSATSTLQAVPTGAGSSTFATTSSSSKKSTLSGEETGEESEEESEEEIEEEPEEEIVEEPIEEPQEEPEEEPTEEEIKNEEDILKEATKKVTTTITDKIYTAPPAPAPAQPAPTTAQPAPSPELFLDKAVVNDAIGRYLAEPILEPKELLPADPEIVKEKATDSANEIFERGESIEVFIKGEKKTVENQEELEQIIEEVDLTKSDIDGDGLSDAFAVSNSVPLFQKDPDGDSYSNEKEIYCGLNPSEADELQPKVANLERATSGNMPAFRLCAGTTGDNYEIYLMDQETEEQTLLGEVPIDEDNRGVFIPETAIPDGSYYILAKKSDEEELFVSSFDVTASEVPISPEIQLVSVTEEGLELGPTVRFVITFNGKIFAFDPEKFIASSGAKINGVTRTYIKGASEPRLVAYATWKSRILGSVVLADATSGEFELEIPADLPPGEHEILVYVEDQENNLISSVARLLYTK